MLVLSANWFIRHSLFFCSWVAFIIQCQVLHRKTNSHVKKKKKKTKVKSLGPPAVSGRAFSLVLFCFAPQRTGTASPTESRSSAPLLRSPDPFLECSEHMTHDGDGARLGELGMLDDWPRRKETRDGRDERTHTFMRSYERRGSSVL